MSEQWNQYTLNIEFHYELSRKPSQVQHSIFGPVDAARREIETAFVEAGYTLPITSEHHKSSGSNANDPMLEVWRDDERIHAVIRAPVPGKTFEEAQACIRYILKGLVAEGSFHCTEEDSMALRRFVVGVAGSVEVWAADEAHAQTLGSDSIRQKSVYSEDKGMDFTDITAWADETLATADQQAEAATAEPAP